MGGGNDYWKKIQTLHQEILICVLITLNKGMSGKPLEILSHY